MEAHRRRLDGLADDSGVASPGEFALRLVFLRVIVE